MYALRDCSRAHAAEHIQRSHRLAPMRPANAAVQYVVGYASDEEELEGPSDEEFLPGKRAKGTRKRARKRRVDSSAFEEAEEVVAGEEDEGADADLVAGKKKCKYGTRCFRTNPLHLDEVRPRRVVKFIV